MRPRGPEPTIMGPRCKPKLPLEDPTAMRLAVSFLAAAFLLSCAKSNDPSPAVINETEPPVLLTQLGDLHHPITTTSGKTQRYFDQGLVLVFGFNHEAAIRSFQEAARNDPKCAMCQWGIGLALGPNINAPMGPEAAKQAYAATQKAQALAPGASPKEQAYIAALAKRYAAEPPEDRSALDLAYAEAMRDVREQYPDDLDAATLAAEALMDLSPWAYWTPDAQPGPHTGELVAVLEGVMKKNPKHVGANHYYIHAVEEFYPEKGEAAADRLGTLAPQAGHLVHMPSHIYWRVGRYDDAMTINQQATAADEQYFSWCKPGALYRALYYPHNVHFLWAAASAQGRSEIALTSARKLAQKTRGQLEAFPFLQEFQAVPLQTLVRFGKWDAVLGEPAPDPSERYLVGVYHYARGIAQTRTGRLDAAQEELAALREVAAEPAASELMLAGATAPAKQLLDISLAHLEGELAAARGDQSAAIAALERAVALQDELVYMEPPPFYFPTRQALGAVLLEAGRPEDAARVYRQDLAQYPKNGWSLYGLSQALAAQRASKAASYAKKGYERAFAKADVELQSSRF